jgi:hypothetical protein
VVNPGASLARLPAAHPGRPDRGSRTGRHRPYPHHGPVVKALGWLAAIAVPVCLLALVAVLTVATLFTD